MISSSVKGRGQSAEVRITDISVSRFHTQIKLNKNGEVYIKDNNSKFGTLIELTDPLAIKTAHPVYLQIGRCVLVLFSVNRFSCMQRCLCAVSKARKRETCLHYDEVSQYFPNEFTVFFNQLGPKKTKSTALKNDNLIENSQQQLM